MIVLGYDDRQIHGGHGAPFDLFITINNGLAEEIEELGRAITAALKLEEALGRIDQGGGGLSGLENLVADDVFDEGDVGLDSADAHFAKRAFHPLDGQLEVAGRCGKLDQKGVIERGDDGPGVAHRAVEANAKTGGTAVVDNFSVVRGEVFFRVLGGYAGLNGDSVARDILLFGDANFLAM